MLIYLQDYVVTTNHNNDDIFINETIVNFCFINCDPIFYKDAVVDEQWIQAIDDEIYSIGKNDTWDLTS